jgi:alcohol dehydrogenase
VVFSPHLVARENVGEPAQVLIGLTSFGAGSERLQADWRDGALAEFSLAPVASVTPAERLSSISTRRNLAVLNRFSVPFGGLLRSGLRAGETLIYDFPAT